MKDEDSMQVCNVIAEPMDWPRERTVIMGTCAPQGYVLEEVRLRKSLIKLGGTPPPPRPFARRWHRNHRPLPVDGRRCSHLIHVPPEHAEDYRADEVMT